VQTRFTIVLEKRWAVNKGLNFP